MYSYLDDTGQACFDLGFAEWSSTQKKRYNCEREECDSKENLVPCLHCANTFYCSVKCRNADAKNHSTICNITNTREMLFIDTYLGYKLGPVLTLIAKAKYQQMGPGVINVRSYTPIRAFEHVPSSGELEVAMQHDTDVDEAHLFITYIPLDVWCEQVRVQGFEPLDLLSQNDYTSKMIVNFHLEEMNKQQLHRLPMSNIDCSEFINDEYSKLSMFQMSIPWIVNA